MPHIDRATAYEIKVRGQLDESWSDWFDNMDITVENEHDDPPITILTGVVVDQAALQGILHRIHDLNLELISVTRIDPNSENE